MKSPASKWMWLALLLLCAAVFCQHRRLVRITGERDRYERNNTALLADVERFRTDSATMALDCRSLTLTLEEYERFRAEDAEKIRSLGVKLKNLEAAARHEMVVQGEINAALRDTVVVRDTVPVLRQRVEMNTPHIRLSGLIEDDRLKGDIYIPVTLRQAVWVEYRGWWLWKRVKAVHQTVSSDNPYVEVKYSECIRISR